MNEVVGTVTETRHGSVRRRVSYLATGLGILFVAACSEGGEDAGEEEGNLSGGMGGAIVTEGSGGAVFTGGQPATGGAQTSGGTASMQEPDSDVGEGPGRPITIEQYCERRIAMEKPWCDYIDECCSAEDQADLHFVTPHCNYGRTTLEECVDGFAGVLEAGVKWDGTWADACLLEQAPLYPDPPATCSGLAYDEWKTLGQGLPSASQRESCDQMLQGSVQKGQDCSYDAECDDGLRCTSVAEDVFQCQDFGTTGTECYSDGDCELGLFCVRSGDERRCGQPVGYLGECYYTTECQEGLVCNIGECVYELAPGAACDLLDACEGAYGCGYATDSCIPLGFPGDPCTTSGECQGRCDTNLGQCTNICGGILY